MIIHDLKANLKNQIIVEEKYRKQTNKEDYSSVSMNKIIKPSQFRKYIFVKEIQLTKQPLWLCECCGFILTNNRHILYLLHSCP